MASSTNSNNLRRSTRVPLKIEIGIESGSERVVCEGETILVNLHGALIATEAELALGMRVSIRVYLTDKSAKATVVYVDRENQRHFGVELDRPQNIWGVSLPPDDWEQTLT